MRLIDADALNYVRVRIYHDDGTIGGYNAVVPSSEINHAPTVDAVPVSLIEELKVWAKENGSAEYVYFLTHLLSVWAERKEECG